MRIGIEFVPDKPIEKLVDWTKLVKKAGFDNIWITDHYSNRNVWATVDTLALNTERVMSGPRVTNPYHVSPTSIASAAVIVDEFNNGCAMLDIGAGDKLTLNGLGIESIR